MADINLSLDPSSISALLDALEFRKKSLQRTASKKREAEQRPHVAQVDLLIDVLKSLQPAGQVPEEPQ